MWATPNHVVPKSRQPMLSRTSRLMCNLTFKLLSWAVCGRSQDLEVVTANLVIEHLMHGSTSATLDRQSSRNEGNPRGIPASSSGGDRVGVRVRLHHVAGEILTWITWSRAKMQRHDVRASRSTPT
jgi:hypothetical protein